MPTAQANTGIEKTGAVARSVSRVSLQPNRNTQEPTLGERETFTCLARSREKNTTACLT
jgi:hypothetical protein